MRARNRNPAVPREATWLWAPPFPRPNLLPWPRPGPCGLSRLPPPVPPRWRWHTRTVPGASSSGRGSDRAQGAGGAGPRPSPELTPRRQRGPHLSVGPARERGWVAGGCLPDSLWLDPGPEGAAGEGHLDLQPTGPPRDGPRPSTRRSPRACPGRRRLRMSGLPLPDPGPLATRPRGLLCPPLTRQAREGRSGSPLALAHTSPPPPPQLPGGPGHGPGRRHSPGPSPRRLPRAVAAGSAAGTAGAAARGTQRAAGPRAGQRGRRRRGPAPTRPVPPSELRPRARPGTPPGPGPGSRFRSGAALRVRARGDACVRPGTGWPSGCARGECVRRDRRAGRRRHAVPAGNSAGLKHPRRGASGLAER